MESKRFILANPYKVTNPDKNRVVKSRHTNVKTGQRGKRRKKRKFYATFLTVALMKTKNCHPSAIFVGQNLNKRSGENTKLVFEMP